MDAHDLYEPWRPTIGQRVTIRLSPECREDWGLESDGAGVEAHPAWANGRTGVVIRTGPGDTCRWPRESMARHPYCVRLDVRGPGWTWGLHLAAAELEPLD